MRLANYFLRLLTRAYVSSRNLYNFIGIKYAIDSSRESNSTLLIIFGTPEHSNIGDIAIEWAEQNFIKKRMSDYSVVSIPVEVMSRYFKQIETLILPSDVLLGHGGGNMGDTYPMEEEFRRKVISTFSNNRILTFPQTVYFSQTTLGKKELKKTQSVYAAHTDLTLIARETISRKYMVDNFSSNRVILTPDIVLSSEMYKVGTFRKGALACLRADKEAVLSENERSSIVHFLSEKYDDVGLTDTVSYSKFFPFMSKKKVLFKKLKQFSSSEFIVTDRLHGMVFAAITGTPCIALTNFNHKVLGTYRWIESLDYIRFCNDPSEIQDVYKSMITKPGMYDPGKFDNYWNEIVSAIEDDK